MSGLTARTLTTDPMIIDTSEASKAHSQEVVDALGDTAHYGDKDQPHSKSAANNIEGSRAM